MQNRSAADSVKESEGNMDGMQSTFFHVESLQYIDGIATIKEILAKSIPKINDRIYVEKLHINLRR